MQRLTILAIATFLVICFTAFHSCSQITQVAPDIFVASTPCGAIAKPLLGIPAGVDCERIQWKLSLLRQNITDSAGIWMLSGIYGLTALGTPGFMNDGKQVEVSGRWITVNGIYRLTTGKPGISLSFLKLGDRLLHLLDANGHLMIGNASWSYTLYKL